MEPAIASILACTGIVILIVVASIAAAFVKTKRTRSRLDVVFAGREPLTEEEFHYRYFASKGIPFFVSAGVRKVLAAELQADLARLSADDDFSGNLSFLRDELEDPETLLSLEHVFEIRLSESDVHEMGTTVGDIIDVVWKTLKKNEKLKQEANVPEGQNKGKMDRS